MRINVWEYLDDYTANKEEILKAVADVFQSGQLILGPKVKEFEQKYAQYIGTEHAVGCDNGTNALILALRALGIGGGNEVITVPNTAIPTVSAIVTVGATPVFVDIDPKTYLMDISQIEATITSRTKAILPVHLYGQCVDMDPLMAIAKKHGLYVLEDCAQAHGAEYKGKKAGSMGDISATSFYPTKVLGAYGDGGMINTQSSEFDAHLRKLRFYGTNGSYYAQEHGYNSRLDEVQAAILLTKLPKIEANIERRRAIAMQYNHLLSNTSLILPQEAEHNRHVYYLYVVRHPQRDKIIERVKEYDIHLNISYPWPIHLMDGYSYLGYKEGQFPEAEAAAKEIFSLPMFPNLTDDKIQYICKALHNILEELV